MGLIVQQLELCERILVDSIMLSHCVKLHNNRNCNNVNQQAVAAAVVVDVVAYVVALQFEVKQLSINH